MAVFLINICKFNGCGVTFPSLTDLIQHIEDTHIDYDPKVVEQKEATQPACLPLSYVLRFISENVPKEGPFLTANSTGVDLKRKLAIKHHSYSISSSNRSNTPTGSEMDEDDMAATDSEDSNDSWTTEEFSSEFIMRYGARHSGVSSNGNSNNEKPFACPVPGCKKRYKNVNGIKYHSKNGHKKDGKVRKGFKCHCGKSYKNANSLKNHAMATHNSSPTEIQLTAQHVANVSNGYLSPSQSLGSLSPSSMSNMSSNSNHNINSLHNGNNNNNNNNNNSSNNNNNNNPTSVLHQLTNGMGMIATNNNVSNSVIGVYPPLTTNGLSLQQLNITANNNNINNNNNNINNNNSNASNSSATTIVAGGTGAAVSVAAVNSAATSDFSPCPIHHTNWRNTNNTINNAALNSAICTTTAISPTSFLNSGVTAAATPIPTTIITATATVMNSSTVATTTTTTTPIQNNNSNMPMRTLIVKTMLPNGNSAQARTFQPIHTVLPTSMGISPTKTLTINRSADNTTRISPTFIEHKYSANTFKEKFLANLRHNRILNTTTTATITTTTIIKDNDSVAKMKTATTLPKTATSNNTYNNIKSVGTMITTSAAQTPQSAGNDTGNSNGEKCTMQLHLNENCNNVFHKKSII